MSKYTEKDPIFSEPPTREQVLAVYDYDRETGTLIRRKTIGRAKKGTSPTVPTFWGYLRVHYRQKEYKVHRLIYLIETGEYPQEIDHINGVMTDNRFYNLRPATTRTNSMNRKLANRPRSTKLVGVYVVKKTGRFRATIGLHNNIVCLGTYTDFFEAACARKSAEVFFGYHPNHGKTPEARAEFPIKKGDLTAPFSLSPCD